MGIDAANSLGHFSDRCLKMAIIISYQSDEALFGATMEQVRYLDPEDETDMMIPFPAELGRGQTRKMDLREELDSPSVLQSPAGLLRELSFRIAPEQFQSFFGELPVPLRSLLQPPRQPSFVQAYRTTPAMQVVLQQVATVDSS